MRTLNFGRTVVYKQNKSIDEDLNGRMVTPEKKINGRGPYNLAEWSCTNKKNKSMRTLILVMWS